MRFVIARFDRPGALERRQTVRPAHLGYLESQAAQIRPGGPFLDEDDQSVGSVLIVEAANRAAAEASAADDPYHDERVFERVEIRPWRAVLGAW